MRQVLYGRLNKTPYLTWNELCLYLFTVFYSFYSFHEVYTCNIAKYKLSHRLLLQT